MPGREYHYLGCGVRWIRWRPGWHYRTLSAEAGFIIVLGHAITPWWKVLDGFSVTWTDSDRWAISWWFLTQQTPWLVPTPCLRGRKWYAMAVAGVLGYRSAARSVLNQTEELSIVSVAWENSLLVYSQLTLQVREKLTSVLTFRTEMPVTTQTSSAFNKQQEGSRCSEGFTLLLHCPGHPCRSLQLSQVTLAAWPHCCCYFNVTGLHLLLSHWGKKKKHNSVNFCS